MCVFYNLLNAHSSFFLFSLQPLICLLLSNFPLYHLYVNSWQVLDKFFCTFIMFMIVFTFRVFLMCNLAHYNLRAVEVHKYLCHDVRFFFFTIVCYLVDVFFFISRFYTSVELPMYCTCTHACINVLVDIMLCYGA